MSALSRSRSTRKPTSTPAVDLDQSQQQQQQQQQQPHNDSRTAVSPSRLPRAGGTGGLARSNSVIVTNNKTTYTSATTSRAAANAPNVTTMTAVTKPVRARPLSGSSISALARSNSVRNGNTATATTSTSTTATATREAPADRSRPPITARGRHNARPTSISVLPSAVMKPLPAGPASATATTFSAANAASFARNGDLQQQQQQPQKKHARAKSSGLAPLSLNLTSATTLRALGSGGPKSPASASVSTESSTVNTVADSKVGQQRSARSSATALGGKETGRPPPKGEGAVDESRSRTGPLAAATTTGTTQRRQTTSSVAASSSAPGGSVTGGTSAKRMSPTCMDPAKQSSSSLLSATSSTNNTASSAPSQAARLRPAFTTLQQHYSPAHSLAPKPTTASILAPPSPSKLPANVALSTETSRLQTDLLQLHALHRVAAPVDAQWRDSARRRLAARFRDVRSRASEASREEAEVRGRKNVLALSAWGSTSGRGREGMALEEKIQTLDIVLSGLWALDEQQRRQHQQPGTSPATTTGKYARVVRRFERWAERAADLAERRRRLLRLHGQDREDLVAIGEQEAEELLAPVLQLGGGGSGAGAALDDAWRDECAALARRLDEWRARLAELGDVPGEDGAASEADEGQREDSGRDDDSVVGSDDEEEAEATKRKEKEEPPDASSLQTPPSSLATILRSCQGLVADMLAELNMMAQIEREVAAQETEWVRAMIRLGDDDDDGVGGRRTHDAGPGAGAIWRAF